MFEVHMADNFHYMDADETYKHGEFATWAEAMAAAQGIVDACLRDAFQPGATAEGLYERYVMFGDDPHIVPVPEGERFSAWDYAKQRCQEMCSPRSRGAGMR